MKKNKLILCDLDGTLFDTTKVNYYSYKKALNELGYDMDYDFFIKECYGKHYKTFLPIIGLNEEEMEKVHKIKKKTYSEYLNEAKVNVHLFNILELIKSEYYIALVTTASTKNSEEILKYFNKKGLFDLIVAAEDIKNKKPNPEGFIKAMSHFNISPEDAFIFEDSDVGIEAAVRSKANIMKVEKF